MLRRDNLPSKMFEDLGTILNNSYERFRDNIINRDKRPMLLGRTIYVDERSLYDGKENSFWHCSSMGEDDTKFDQDPCENDDTKKLCEYKCNINHEKNFLKDNNRIPCIYRADKSIWINEVINMVNSKDLDNIKMWKFKNQNKETDFKIWYDDGDISYVLIFRINYNKERSGIQKYVLKSAYPVVLKSYRKRFIEEYIKGKVELK